MFCFYHTDMDGHCSGAIVNLYYKYKDGNKKFIAINYNQNFPFDLIAKDETVVIVDFSLQKEGDFEKLLAITPNIIWIDHHKTAIEKHSNIADKIPGLRKDGTAACELTWNYFFPESPMPPVVKLLGDYDTWTFKYKEDTENFQSGVRLTSSTEPEADCWNVWLNSSYYPYDEINEGRIANCYKRNYYASLVKGWAFYVNFEGYRGICCNAGSVSSSLFDSVPENTYDIMIPFCFDGTIYSVSLYTKDPNIDVSKIAVKYGGGGHKQAAGFQTTSLNWEFIRKFNNKK